MSGQNRLINSESEIEGSSFEEQVADLNNANTIAGEITDSADLKDAD